ncbi:hypothetical protein PAXRUDRAFT_178964, partial [Paxillus rubicundulus Ve08.2h10]
WPGDQRCWPLHSGRTPYSRGSKSGLTTKSKKTSGSLQKKNLVIKEYEENIKFLREHKPFQLILELIPDLIKMPVYPLTGLPHWLQYPYAVGDSLNPEAIYQEITGHEILTWGYLNSLDTSRIVFPYANGQNLLNKVLLLHTDNVSVQNPHFFPILNFHILEADNGRTWTNTYISLSFFDEFGFNFFDSDLSVPSENALNAYETSIVSRTESQEASTSYQGNSSAQTPPKTNIPLPPVILPNIPITKDTNQNFQQITEFISLGIF